MTIANEMRLSLIQMNSGPDRDANVEKACEYIDQAIETHQSNLVVIPEFFNQPYVFNTRDQKNFQFAEPQSGYSISRMRKKARERNIYLIATLYEEESAGIYYDTAFVIDPNGEIIGKYRKVMPGLYLSLERIYFRFGSHFNVFQVGDWKVGIVICYDTFFPEHARCSAVNGAELIVVPFAAPKVGPWREMMITRAWENAVYFAPCNKVGPEGGWQFGGVSMIIDPEGEVLSEAGEEKDEIINATLNRTFLFETRQKKPFFRDRRPDLYTPLCRASEDISSAE
jgi:predicted amidohydrolase